MELLAIWGFAALGVALIGPAYVAAGEYMDRRKADEKKRLERAFARSLAPRGLEAKHD